jgi:hypothetical protein
MVTQVENWTQPRHGTGIGEQREQGVEADEVVVEGIHHGVRVTLEGRAHLDEKRRFSARDPAETPAFLEKFRRVSLGHRPDRSTGT